MVTTIPLFISGETEGAQFDITLDRTFEYSGHVPAASEWTQAADAQRDYQSRVVRFNRH